MCRCVYASSSSLNDFSLSLSPKYLDLLSVMYADKRKYEMPYICFQCWALRVLNVPPFLVCSLKLVQFNSWDFYLLYSLCVFRICYSEVLWLWFLRNIPLESAVCSPAEDVSWRGTVFTQRKTIVRNTRRCFLEQLEMNDTKYFCRWNKAAILFFFPSLLLLWVHNRLTPSLITLKQSHIRLFAHYEPPWMCY